jgi:hypothetical protein
VKHGWNSSFFDPIIHTISVGMVTFCFCGISSMESPAGNIPAPLPSSPTFPDIIRVPPIKQPPKAEGTAAAEPFFYGRKERKRDIIKRALTFGPKF